MKKILLLFIVLFFITPCAIFARTWVQIDDNNFIDKDSIKTYINDKGEYDFNKKNLLDKVCWK